MLMKNDKIVIQRVTDGRDAYGGTSETWNTLSTVWADVEQASGSEQFNSDMIVYNDVKRFTIYYNHGQDVTAKDRIVYRSDNYQITSISHRDRLETIIIAVRYDDE